MGAVGVGVKVGVSVGVEAGVKVGAGVRVGVGVRVEATVTVLASGERTAVSRAGIAVVGEGEGAPASAALPDPPLGPCGRVTEPGSGSELHAESIVATTASRASGGTAQLKPAGHGLPV